jgi:hypothetical protein
MHLLFWLFGVENQSTGCSYTNIGSQDERISPHPGIPGCPFLKRILDRPSFSKFESFFGKFTNIAADGTATELPFNRLAIRSMTNHSYDIYPFTSLIVLKKMKTRMFHH